MGRLITISYTPLEATGGVNRWNRDFRECFPNAQHYSWFDYTTSSEFKRYITGYAIATNLISGEKFPYPDDPTLSEWEKARLLHLWLLQTQRRKADDIVIGDGWWAGEYFSEMTCTVRHGIWSHLTKEMADAGMQPEFPVHHAVQVDYTRRHIERGGKVIAVSDFVARQCKLQWGFEMGVINNAIDLEKFHPPVQRVQRDRPLVIHGVTTANKGLDHIAALERGLEAEVLLLDAAQRALGLGDKYESLGQADLVIQPSAYEGNSYFVLETLACGVPIVAYNVGLLNSISEICQREGLTRHTIGCVIDRKLYSPEETLKVSRFILESVMRDRTQYNPREVAELFSIQRFGTEWQNYLMGQFGGKAFDQN
jgi:hypothetical protein